MSFHLPHRGLPQELRDMIYKLALCPPEGIEIQGDFNWRPLEPITLRVKCVPHIASGLLRTNCQVHDSTLPVLYSGNVFTLDTSCSGALKFLRTLPEQSLLLIKNLSLSNKIMDVNVDSNPMSATLELSKLLLANLRLENVTIAMPVESDLEDDTEYEWFPWTLHTALINAFHTGRFHEVRLAYPATYAEDVSVYSFFQIQCIGSVLLEGDQDVIDTMYWNSRHEAIRNGGLRRDSHDAVYEFERDVWHRAGYTIERDSSRPGEKGTFLVVRRIPAPL